MYLVMYPRLSKTSISRSTSAHPEMEELGGTSTSWRLQISISCSTSAHHDMEELGDTSTSLRPWTSISNSTSADPDMEELDLAEIAQ